MNEREPGLAWRRAAPDDLDAVMLIQSRVHSLMGERREVFADKMRLFGKGSLVLGEPGHVRGYGVAHPWRLDDAPPLDSLLGALPDPAECLFLHDVALMPEARGHGAGAAFVRLMGDVARARSLPTLALVSVYGTVPVWERCGFRLGAGLPPGKLDSYGETARYMTASPT